MSYFQQVAWMPGYPYPTYMLPSPAYPTSVILPVYPTSMFPQDLPRNADIPAIASHGLQETTKKPPFNEKPVPLRPSQEALHSKRQRRIGTRAKIRKPSKMKPQRSALTNITNQLLTFLYLRRKNAEVLRRISANLTREQIQNYYEFAKELKQSMYGCVNEQRLGRFWLGKHPDEDLNYSLLRRLSLHYLENGVIPAILTSQRMPAHAKPIHLAVRRKLLRLLNQESEKLDSGL